MQIIALLMKVVDISPRSQEKGDFRIYQYKHSEKCETSYTLTVFGLKPLLRVEQSSIRTPADARADL